MDYALYASSQLTTIVKSPVPRSVLRIARKDISSSLKNSIRLTTRPLIYGYKSKKALKFFSKPYLESNPALF
jgi:hypothetical protein